MEVRSPRIRVTEAALILGCSKSTVWAWVKKGYLPQPHKVGNRFTYWLRDEIEMAAISGVTKKAGLEV